MDEKKTPVIGLPRALLYHRYGTLWQTYFESLGVETVLSPVTNREILENGSALAMDESCLSAKLYLGHVQTLIGKCDQVFIPRYSSLERDAVFCTRFEGLYDQTRNIFRASGQGFLSCDIDQRNRHGERDAYVNLGKKLGFSARDARSAYQSAVKVNEKQWRERVEAQEEEYRKPGMKILLVGRSYMLSDPYVGRPISDYLKSIGVSPLRADVTDRDAAVRESGKYSPTCRWLMSRELIGSVLLHQDMVDGVILLSAFPCGPDSMVNEMLTRKLKGISILNLVLDAQSGMAGVETRLESFVDIIRFKEGAPV